MCVKLNSLFNYGGTEVTCVCFFLFISCARYTKSYSRHN